MHIAILTFDGFNELDSLISLGILNRVKRPGWRVLLTCPTSKVRSMNGVILEAQSPLSEARSADAVIVGSGINTREIVRTSAIMEELRLDPARQVLGAQCSGALILAKLNLLRDVPACTDLMTKPWVEDAGVKVLNQPFYAEGNIATAGGCLSAQYLSAWMIARLAGIEEAKKAIHYVAPVGEKELYVDRAIRQIEPYLPEIRDLPSAVG
jgi:transcriptional regulator GlxA family with amidase domain